jgi:hypothetical protein
VLDRAEKIRTVVEKSGGDLAAAGASAGVLPGDNRAGERDHESNQGSIQWISDRQTPFFFFFFLQSSHHVELPMKPKRDRSTSSVVRARSTRTMSRCGVIPYQDRLRKLSSSIHLENRWSDRNSR